MFATIENSLVEEDWKETLVLELKDFNPTRPQPSPEKLPAKQSKRVKREESELTLY